MIILLETFKIIQNPSVPSTQVIISRMRSPENGKRRGKTEYDGKSNHNGLRYLQNSRNQIALIISCMAPPMLIPGISSIIVPVIIISGCTESPAIFGAKARNAAAVD